SGASLRVRRGRRLSGCPSRLESIAALGLIDDRVHPVGEAAEDRVAAVEMRLGRVRDEELRPARVGTRKSHADRAARVLLQVDLVADRISGAAFHVVPWIAPLDDEI